MIPLLLKVCLLFVNAVLAVPESANPCSLDGLLARCKNAEQLPSSLPPTVTVLLVQSTPVYKLDYSFFGSGSLSNIQHLEMVGGNISHVSPQTFSRISNLEILHLGSTKIRSLPKGVFKGLDRIQRIVVDKSSLQHINHGVFQDAAAALQAIILHHNNIEDISPGAFAQLPNLHLLNLDANRLSKLRQDMFEGLPELRDLFLQHNAIRDLPRGVFQSLRNLRTLAISNNQLTSLSPACLRGLQHLQVLILNNNKLQHLQQATFKLLKDLEQLQINDNLLTVVKAGAFEGLSRLLFLSLNGNKISKIEDDAFKGLDSLSSLMLHRNKLKTIEGFTHLPSLVNLELKNNDISQIPQAALTGVPQLKHLSLKHNVRLRTISPDAFKSNTHLKNLNLLGCKSLIIPTDRPLINSASLCYINLDDAGIHELPDAIFEGVPKLERVALNGNKLTTLARWPFRSLRKGGILEASRNPLACDCALKEILQWSEQAGIHISGTCLDGAKTFYLSVVQIPGC